MQGGRYDLTYAICLTVALICVVIGLVANVKTVEVVPMQIKYELRCKKIPRKYLDRKGCIYCIYWVNKANRTFDVLYIKYLLGMEHTEDNIQAVVIEGYIVAVKPAELSCPDNIRLEIETLAKYTELWAIYPNYKRRVW